MGSLSVANSTETWALYPWLPAQEGGHFIVGYQCRKFGSLYLAPAQEGGLFIPGYQRRKVDCLSLANSAGSWALYPLLPEQEGGLFIPG